MNGESFLPQKNTETKPISPEAELVKIKKLPVSGQPFYRLIPVI